MILDSSIFDIPLINNVIVYEETDSTNTRAKYFGQNGSVDGTLVLADTQTAGKGRLGRSFESPNDGIYMSLMIKPHIDIRLASMITIVTATAVAKALMQLDIPGISIKWPNDILINNRKCIGILSELSTAPINEPKIKGCADLPSAISSYTDNDSQVKFIVIGIGINVNNRNFSDKLSNKATSLMLETGRTYDKEAIIHAILTSLDKYINIFLKDGGLQSIVDDYNELLACTQKDIYIIPHELTEACPNTYELPDSLIKKYELTPYKCIGINEYGELLYQTSDGNIDKINSGEVSIRN